MCIPLYLEKVEKEAKIFGNKDKLVLSPAYWIEDLLEFCDYLFFLKNICEIRWPNIKLGIARQNKMAGICFTNQP